MGVSGQSLLPVATSLYKIGQPKSSIWKSSVRVFQLMLNIPVGGVSRHIDL